jgi:hypothetical protein
MTVIRELIHLSVPQTTEEFKWGRPVFRIQKDFAYLKTAKNYVTLGFFNANRLHDPLSLLEGTGKEMRHVKLKSIDDINSPLISDWLATISES